MPSRNKWGNIITCVIGYRKKWICSPLVHKKWNHTYDDDLFLSEHIENSKLSVFKGILRITEYWYLRQDRKFTGCGNQRNSKLK